MFFVNEKQAHSQSVGTSFYVGNIVRHRPFLAFEQPNFTSALELEYIAKKSADSDWQRFWRFPDITHHFHIHNFGNPKELGTAFAYYPTVNFTIFEKNNFSFDCQMGNGISYLTRKYSDSNPANNAIGSHWNSIITLGFELKYFLKNNYSLSLGPQIFHYSNGSAKAPNAGINTISMMLGLKKIMSEAPQYQKGTKYKSSGIYDKWNFEINLGLGFRQINIPNGLTYRVPQVSLFAHYNLFEFFRIVGGLSYQYNYADYYFQKTQFEPNAVAGREARDYLAKFSGDFLFGNVFARFQFGFYLPLEEKISRDPFSTMFSLNYARKIISTSETKLFFGVGVRSHKFVAQYLSLNAGIIL